VIKETGFFAFGGYRRKKPRRGKVGGKKKGQRKISWGRKGKRQRRCLSSNQQKGLACWNCSAEKRRKKKRKRRKNTGRTVGEYPAYEVLSLFGGMSSSRNPGGERKPLLSQWRL